jgi:hypothetical protein
MDENAMANIFWVLVSPVVHVSDGFSMRSRNISLLTDIVCW